MKKYFVLLITFAFGFSIFTLFPNKSSGQIKKNINVSAGSTFDKWNHMTASFGWEGDLNAPISYMDGSFDLRSRGYAIDNQSINDYQKIKNHSLRMDFGYGATDSDRNKIISKIQWSNKEGYLPCFVHQYTVSGDNNAPLFDIKIENFSDMDTYSGRNNFEISYSRMTVKNLTDTTQELPKVRNGYIQIRGDYDTYANIFSWTDDLFASLTDNNPNTVSANQTVVRDYAIASDRFSSAAPEPEYPSVEQIKAHGSFDSHYNHMKNYWNERLEGIANITVPDQNLVNAYKAGYIYMMIIKDDIYNNNTDSIRRELRIGEQGYDNYLWDHDTEGLIASLINLGDPKYIKDYLETIPPGMRFSDALYKFSWPFALYLLKTNDIEYIKEKYTVLSNNAHKIHDHRDDNGNGIMARSDAIDSDGHWTVDNYSALTGLLCFEYIAKRVNSPTDATWAKNEYNSLYNAVEQKVKQLQNEYKINYLPFSLDYSNTDGRNPRNDPNDANRLSMYMFGRWDFDGLLFGANTNTYLHSIIDKTYENVFSESKKLNRNQYNFGGYPGYSSAYNAGYGEAALVGEKYRDTSIKAYQWMIANATSGPYSWWEGQDYPDSNNPLEGTRSTASYFSSCQHMWGQSVALKTLVESLIAQKADNTLLIGRGLPNEWFKKYDQKISIHNYLTNNIRTGYTITPKSNSIVIDWDSNSNQNRSVELDILKNNMYSVVGGSISNKGLGTVFVPKNVKQTIIYFKNPNPTTYPTLKKIKQKGKYLKVYFKKGNVNATVTIKYKKKKYKFVLKKGKSSHKIKIKKLNKKLKLKLRHYKVKRKLVLYLNNKVYKKNIKLKL